MKQRLRRIGEWMLIPGAILFVFVSTLDIVWKGRALGAAIENKKAIEEARTTYSQRP